MTATDLPLDVEPHVSDTGRAWVEAVVTGTAAITLARAVAQRLAGQGITDPRVTETLIVTLIAGAITDTGIEMTPEAALDLADHLTGQVDVALDPVWQTGTTAS